MIIKITFETQVPEDIPIEDLREWIEYETGAIDRCKVDSQLLERGLQATPHSVTVEKV